MAATGAEMGRVIVCLRAMAALALALALTGPLALAQQRGAQQRDPFAGKFGVWEVGLRPQEALRQAELLNGALGGLEAQRPGVADVYIVSIALWADPVFEREASQIMADHFAAQRRMIVLTQGAGYGQRAFPAATPYHINAALARIGALIDPAEDIVVVFVTSHGSQDGSAAILEQNRIAGALRPVHLREALTDAGIRNRVVIVSACYSGAFIAPLMDPNTAVLTAAAPDRTSFGCQPNREWTYFGDALFNHALRERRSLVASFESAAGLVSQWETAQRLSPPSNPQKFVGAAIGPLLARAEREAR
jgi:hypothetical protein